jgi:cysteine synthase
MPADLSPVELCQLPGRLDYLVATVRAADMIHGVARALRRINPALRVVAVDAVGSVIFGG